MNTLNRPAGLIVAGKPATRFAAARGAQPRFLMLLGFLCLSAVSMFAAPFTIEWTSVTPTVVENMQVYTVEARGYDEGGNLVNVMINKNGAPFAYAGASDGVGPYEGYSHNPSQDAGDSSGASRIVTFTAWAVDSSGAESTRITRDITVKGPKVPPTIHWTSAPGVVPQNSWFTIRADAHDANGNLVTVNIYRNGQPFAYELNGNQSDAYSDNPDHSYLPRGTKITYTAEAQDSDGLRSSLITQEVYVAYVNSLPIAGISPSSISTYINASYNFTVSGSDPENDLSAVKLYEWAWEHDGVNYWPREDTMLRQTWTSSNGGPISQVWSGIGGKPWKWQYEYLATSTDVSGAVSYFSNHQTYVQLNNNPPATPTLTSTQTTLQLGQSVDMSSYVSDQDANVTYHDLWWQFRGPNNDQEGAWNHVVERSYASGTGSDTIVYTFTPTQTGYYRLKTRANDPYVSTTDVLVSLQVADIPPQPPTNVHAGTVSWDRIQVLWTKSTSTNVTGQWLYWSVAGGTESSSQLGQNQEGEWLLNLTPSTTYNIYLKANNGFGTKSVASNVLTATTPNHPPVITSPISRNVVRGTAFSYQITASYEPASFDAVGYNGSSLPPGMGFNVSTGIISGTCSVVGDYYVRISATNSGGTGDALLTIRVTDPPTTISGALDVQAPRGQQFNYQIVASNSPTSYDAVADTGSSLPPGVTINTSSGLLSGIPGIVGIFYVRISATNLAGYSEAVLKITVVDAPVILSSQSVSGKRGLAFSYQIAASNLPTGFSVAGTLPPGLNFNPATGVISGKPSSTASGAYALTISATNVAGTATAPLAISVSGRRPAITSAAGIKVHKAGAISYWISANYGPTGYNAVDAATGAGLPAGLSVNTSTGQISGSVATTGTYYLKISASNTDGTGEGLLRLSVDEATSPTPDTSGTPLAATLPSNFAVDNKGAANYTIPLELPPGRGGLEPKLSIGYNSSTGAGLLGVGAALSTGYPREITRGRTILARDGVVRGVNFDTDDKLYLDGKRLIVVSGYNGMPGSVYRTEVDSFVTVTAYGTGPNIEGFRVVTKDGMMMCFGMNVKDASGVAVYTATDGYHVPAGEAQGKALSWALKWAEDTVGNYIEFIYDKTDVGGGTTPDFALAAGEHLLTSIRYTGNRALNIPPRYTVWLRHNNPQNQSGIAAGTPRPDETTLYHSGRFTALSARLDDILVAEGSAGFSAPPRTFRLKYDAGGVNEPTLLRLVEVMQRDTDGPNVTTVATQLDWPGGAQALNLIGQTEAWHDQGSTVQTSPVWQGDFNGDGRHDVLFKSGTSLTVAWRTDAGTWTEVAAPINVGTGYTGPALADLKLATTGDFNGDGRTDLVWSVPGEASKKGGWYVSLASSTGIGFGAPQKMVANSDSYPFTDKVGSPGSALAIDLDGDGRDELLYQTKESIAFPNMSALFDEALFVDSFLAESAPRDSGSCTILPNGRMFVLRLSPETGTWSETEVQKFFDGSVPLSLRKIDLDGDGRADLLATLVDIPEPSTPGYSVDVSWTVQSYRNQTYRDTGNNLVFTFSLTDTVGTHGSTVGSTPGAGHLTLTGDVNGDGLEDIVTFSDADNGWSVALSKGDGTFEKGAFSGIHLTESPGNVPMTTYFQQPGTVQVDTVYDGSGIAAGNRVSIFEGFAITGAILLDLNGDGRKDFVWYAGTSLGWRCFLASRTGFDTSQALSVYVGGVDTFTYQAQRLNNGPFELMCDAIAADPTGSGRDNMLLMFRKDPSQYLYNRLALATNSSSDRFRLTGATDGLGAKLKIGYGAITSDNIYTSGTAVSYPIRETRHLKVVSDVWKDNGGNFAGGESQQFSYQYAGARTDLSGRGFLGFHSFVTLDTKTNLFKYQFLTQSFPMTGLTTREETYRYLGSGQFRFLSSHDNVVVFDEVVKSAADTTPWGTVYPFISRATEYRWENDSTPHFTLTAAGPYSQPEALFPNAKPSGEHIKITAESLFDSQTTVQTSIGGAFAASDTSGGVNTVTGVTAYSTIQGLGLPRKITYGNLVQLKTDFGDGFSEKVVNAYYAPAANGLTGLLHTVDTSVVAPGYGTDALPETAPTKTYTYWGNTTLVAAESTGVASSKLYLLTEYHRDMRGRVDMTTVTGYNNPSDPQHIGTYIASKATAFDDGFDLPTTTTNAEPHFHNTATAYHQLLGLPISVTDMENGTTTSRPKVTTQYDVLGRVIQKSDVFKGLQTDITYALTPNSSATDWKKMQTVAPPAGHTGVASGVSLDGVSGLTLSSAYAVETKQSISATSTAYAPTSWTYYDRLGRIIRTVKENFSLNGKTVTDTAYNSLGQVIATSLPYPDGSATILWTKTAYDALGRVSTVTAPNGTITTSTYNGRATVVTVDAPNLGGVDPAPQTNATVVDAKGRTVKVWNADNVPTFTDTKGATSATPSITFALDGFGRMRKTTLKGQTATIDASYDELGRQIELNDPDKGHWYYLNNVLGQVVRQTDAKNTITDFKFDHLGRPLSRVTTAVNDVGTGNSTETAVWQYYDKVSTASANPSLNLTAAGTGGWIGAPHFDQVATQNAPGYYTDKIAHVHFYDTLGRPEIELVRIDGQHFYTKTEYDTASRPKKVWPAWRPDSENPAPVSNWGYIYSYDAKGYVTSVTDTDNRSWWANPAYDHLDRVKSAQKGNAYYTQRTYRDEDGVLTAIKTGTSVGATTLQNLSFNYDGLGNLTSRTGPGGTETLSYDVLNRLKTSSKQGTMTYFDNGNIQTKWNVDGVASTAYTYVPTKPHAVLTARGYTMGYDANGNVTSRTNSTASESWSFSYPGFDKPRWMAKTTGTTTVGSEFVYDAHRSRVMHLEFDSMTGGAPLRYKYKKIYTAGAGAEADYKLSSDGTAWLLDRTRVYVPAPDGTAGAMVFKSTAGTPEAEVYHHDHLGSIEQITLYGDTSNNPMPDQSPSPGRSSLYSYDAWGERRNPATWVGKPQTTALGGHDGLTPRGFTGHEMLDDLGLVHMNGRIYDPVLGRMLSADILVQEPRNLQAYNRFSYVANNPLAFSDPSGFAKNEALLKAVGKVIEEDGVKVAGRKMINAQFAGKEVTTTMLRESTGIDAKLLDRIDKDFPGISIKYSEAAIPDFSQYAIETFQTTFKESKADITKAWASLKGRYSEAEIAELQKAYTWNHGADETLELVPKDIHDAFRHTGGDAIQRAGILQRAKATITSVVATVAASAVSNTSAAIKNEGLDVLKSGNLEKAALVDVANVLDPGVQLVTNGVIEGVNQQIENVNEVRKIFDKPEINKLPSLDLGDFYDTVIRQEKKDQPK